MRPLLLAALVLCGTACLAGCAHRPTLPPVVPDTVPPAANPAAPVVAPRRASGLYTLTTTLKSSQPAPQLRRGRRPVPPESLLRLESQPLAAPDPTAASGTQLSALVAIPGYTRAPKGRTAQAAAWWPLPGDSVVVHFETPRGDGFMELRGTLAADTIAGAIWYSSTASGSTYEMAKFRAVKRRR
jgi:hypothetical protein